MNTEEQRMDRKESIIELRANCAALAQRNEELDAFACTVAHELKSELTLVVGLGDLLKSCAASWRNSADRSG